MRSLANPWTLETAVAIAGSAGECAQMLASDLERYRTIMRSTGIRLE